MKSPKKIKIIGDQSLSKRDFLRVTKPLEKFGAKFEYEVKGKLPLSIIGSQILKVFIIQKTKDLLSVKVVLCWQRLTRQVQHI